MGKTNPLISIFNPLTQNKRIISFCLLVLMGLNLTESIASQKSIGSAIVLPKPDISHGIPLNSARYVALTVDFQKSPFL